MAYFSAFLLSMFITMALIPIFRANAGRMHVMDLPNGRKMHEHPVPRVGGIAMAIGIAPTFFFMPADRFVKATIIGAAIIFFFGVFDDIKNAGYKLKLIGQLAAAILVVTYGGLEIRILGDFLPIGYVIPSLVAVPLTVLFITGIVNAINLADGLDGLAGGISLMSFAPIGVLAYLTGNYFVALIVVSVMGALFGFLRFNTFPAAIFMGDCGSQLLGFLAAVLSLYLTQHDTYLSPVLPLMLLGFPILDTLTVMAERISKGHSPFKADKNHFHHKLVKIGFFHTESVFIIYFIQSLLICIGFIFRFSGDEWFLLGFYAVFSVFTITFFIWTDSVGWRVKRYKLIDKVIKKKLRVVKEKNLIIRVSFMTVRILYPLLVIIACWLPSDIPRRYSYIALILLVSVWFIRLVNKKWYDEVMTVSIYFMIPIIVFLSEYEIGHGKGDFGLFYNGLFVAMVLSVITTLKFTRREKGFRVTPMDYIILFLALVLPNMSSSLTQSYKIGSLSAKIIAFYFSYEVLVGELRAETRSIALTNSAVLVMVAARGLSGI